MDPALPYSVPAWALQNQKRFLSAPSLPASALPALPAWALENQKRSDEETEQDAMINAAFTEELTAAVAMGLVTTEPYAGIFPPEGPSSASYFRDVKNHPDVLASMINTARLTAGYVPESGLSAREQHQAFQRFLAELNRYRTYMVLTSDSTLIENQANNCNAVLSAVTTVVTNALGNNETSQQFIDGIQNMIKDAAAYVTQGQSSNSYADASYEMVALPAPNGDADRDVDPAAAICQSVVRMSRTVVPGKHGGTVMSRQFAVATCRCRLLSSAVIAYADHLAGSHLTSVERLVLYLNVQGDFPILSK